MFVVLMELQSNRLEKKLSDFHQIILENKNLKKDTLYLLSLIHISEHTRH